MWEIEIMKFLRRHAEPEMNILISAQNHRCAHEINEFCPGRVGAVCVIFPRANYIWRGTNRGVPLKPLKMVCDMVGDTGLNGVSYS